jgi:hypothetical protein
MFTNERIRLYIFSFLAFCVLSSKNIFIYNEETLVALSFFLFLFFVFRYFGNTVKDSLDERSQIIQHELQNFLNIKENSFRELLCEHQKSEVLIHTMQKLDGFTVRELKKLNVNSEKALGNILIDQLEQKLKTLLFSQVALQQKLQHLLSENILTNVLLAFQQVKQQGGSTKPATQTIHKAIELLVSQTGK